MGGRRRRRGDEREPTRFNQAGGLVYILNHPVYPTRSELKEAAQDLTKTLKTGCFPRTFFPTGQRISQESKGEASCFTTP